MAQSYHVLRIFPSWKNDLPDGHVIFRLRIAAITPEFVNWVLYYGSRVEVLEPLKLREQSP